jgi:hypothetical protein
MQQQMIFETDHGSFVMHKDFFKAMHGSPIHGM